MSCNKENDNSLRRNMYQDTSINNSKKIIVCLQYRQNIKR